MYIGYLGGSTALLATLYLWFSNQLKHQTEARIYLKSYSKVARKWREDDGEVSGTQGAVITFDFLCISKNLPALHFR
jgi:hypothetical protein